MAKPTVLVVDSDASRRRELVRGLAGEGYEVVGAASGQEGRRFAGGLKPDVIVAEADLAGEADPRGALTTPVQGGLPAPTTVLMFDTRATFEFPAGVLAAEVGGAEPEVVLHKVRTALLGRELGLASDPLLESVVGDLQTLPIFELLPMLQMARVTGRVLAGGGELFLEDGEVIAARADELQGLKAFCRLARTASGRFRVVLGRSPVARGIYKDLLSLMALAMEDLHLFAAGRCRLPGLCGKVSVPEATGPALSPSQQRVLRDARLSGTLWGLIDRGTEPDGSVLADAASLVEFGALEFRASDAEVRIVTDSTADLPCELARRHQIHVVPLTVTFGTEIYRDGVDLTPEAFYAILGRRGVPHPVTGPPARADFLAAYRMVGERNDVVSLHLSERVSHAVVNARAAAREGRDEIGALRGGVAPALEVVDSTQVSTGLALLAVMAARMAQRRLAASEIRARLETMRGRVHLMFVADTPEYLARGGRVGKTQAWLGGKLGVKPILALEEGEVVPVDRVRRGDAAQVRLIELFKQRVDVGRPVIAGVGHSSAPVLAVRMRNLLQDSFEVIEVIENEIGPVVGAHVGPGCVGAALFQPTEEEWALISPVTEMV
jgi:DegV family protein with EDD domain